MPGGPPRELQRLPRAEVPGGTVEGFIGACQAASPVRPPVRREGLVDVGSLRDMAFIIARRRRLRGTLAGGLEDDEA